jgi:hypothetical protein
MQPENNVVMTVDGDVLTIKVQLKDVAMRASASGKTMLIATTSGNQPCPGRPAVKVGVNIYTARG